MSCFPRDSGFNGGLRDDFRAEFILVFVPQSAEWRILMAEEKKTPVGSCESCEFYDYDEEWEEYVCSISLDEDEMIDFLGRNTGRCSPGNDLYSRRGMSAVVRIRL